MSSQQVLAWVQGETMEQQFGEKEVCFRTLDLYTSAVLEASLNPAATPKQEYRDAMAEMSKVSGIVLCTALPSHGLQQL